MSRDFVVIVTLGTSDVQVVRETDRGTVPLKIKRDQQREFHQACLDGEVKWHMRSLAESGRERLLRSDIKDFKELDYDGDRNVLVIARSRSVSGLDTIECSSGVTLCAPLLADLRESVGQLQQQQLLERPLHVVLVNTHRDGGRYARQEPIGSHVLVRDAVAEAFDLPASKVTYCIFLRGREDLHESDWLGQQHLLTEAARRIDDAVRDMAGLHPNAVAVVCDVGGLPDAKLAIAASCRYRFGGRLRFLRPSEKGEGEHASDKTIVPPAESLLTRMQVANLIRGGAFDAAARSAGAMGQAYEKVEPWRRWIRAVAGVFDGDLNALEEISPEEGSRMRPAISRIVSRGPMLLSAIRVETALLRRNWVWAIRETFTFSEIARDEVLNAAFRKPGKSCFDSSRKKLVLRNVAESYAQRITEEFRDDLDDDGQLFLLSRKRRPEEATVYDRLTAMLPEPARAAIVVFGEAIKPVQSIRNQSTHAPLPARMVHKARSVFVDSGVWSSGKHRFLDNPPVRAFFQVLGVGQGQASEAYDAVVCAILDDMQSHSFRKPDGVTADADL